MSEILKQAGLAVALLATQILPAAADGMRELLRLQNEAKALFGVVLAEVEKPRRCQFDVEWDSYPIPAGYARKYLGLRLHADLQGEHSATRPADVLDPQGRQADSFCDKEVRERYTAERLQAFGEGTDKHTRYSFPVFDERYHTAILVVSHQGSSWRRRADGISRGSFNAHGMLVIYRKRRGIWQEAATEDLFEAH